MRFHTFHRGQRFSDVRPLDCQLLLNNESCSLRCPADHRASLATSQRSGSVSTQRHALEPHGQSPPPSPETGYASAAGEEAGEIAPCRRISRENRARGEGRRSWPPRVPIVWSVSTWSHSPCSNTFALGRGPGSSPEPAGRADEHIRIVVMFYCYFL